MNRSNVLITICSLILSIAAFGCGGGKTENPTTETAGDQTVAAAGTCTTDADCVPDECCHPKACVPKTNAPNCEDMMCTEECKPGTMDCGAGKCVCQNGTCGVDWASN